MELWKNLYFKEFEKNRKLEKKLKHQKGAMKLGHICFGASVKEQIEFIKNLNYSDAANFAVTVTLSLSPLARHIIKKGIEIPWKHIYEPDINFKAEFVDLKKQILELIEPIKSKKFDLNKFVKALNELDRIFEETHREFKDAEEYAQILEKEINTGSYIYGKARKQRIEIISKMTDDELKENVSHGELVLLQLNREIRKRNGVEWKDMSLIEDLKEQEDD